MRIKDVADAAGVSTATVSHVINNTRFVTDETRTRVTRAINKLNYYPNAQARSFALGRSTTLGLVVSDIANPFFPEIVKAVELAAYEQGYDVVLANTSYDAGRTSNYVRRFIERKVAGVLLMTSELDTSLIDELRRQQVAVVFLDLGRPGAQMSNIVVDYELGIEQAIKHLKDLGHTRIAYIGGPKRLRSAVKRLEAFENSIKKFLPRAKPIIREGDFQMTSGLNIATELLGLSPRPTALVVANDLMAFGAVRACRMSGLRVPEDVSVIGYDDIALAQMSDPPLTTVQLPRAELGRTAVEAVMEIIEHPKGFGVERHIATKLLIRDSTAQAPNKH